MDFQGTIIEIVAEAIKALEFDYNSTADDRQIER